MPYDPQAFAVTHVRGNRALSWDPSPSDVADYAVFRREGQTGAAFDPEADTPLVAGIAGTSWTDTAADPTVGYDYQVFGRLGESDFATTFDVYVAPTGDDANDGTYGSPKQTIQAAIASLPSSGERTVGIFDGLYREQVTVTRPGITHLHGESEAGVIVTGAEPYTGWTNESGDVWSVPWTFDWGVVENPWPGDSDPHEGVRRREIVIASGSIVRQHVTYADMAAHPNSFYVDEAADKLYLHRAGMSSGYSAEVGIRGNGILLQGPGSIRYLTIRHTANRFWGNGGLQLEGYHVQTLEDVTVTRCGHDGVKLRPGGDTTLRRVTIHANGYQGLAAQSHEDLLIDDCTVTYNNWRGHWWEYTSWDVGNKQVRNRRCHIKNSRFNHNYSRGLWFDIDCNDVLVEDTEMNDNLRAGTWFEYSPGPCTYRRCQFMRNGVTSDDRRRDGVQINADNVMIENCEITGNTRHGIAVVGDSGRTHSVWAPCTQTLWDGPTINNLPAEGTTFNPRNLNIGWKNNLITVPNILSNDDWCVFIGYTQAGGLWGNEAEIIANLGQISGNHYYAAAGTSQCTRSSNISRTLAQWQSYTGKDGGSTFAAP